MFGHINNLILKVTRDCNLRCEYCYLKNKNAFKDESISLKTIEKIVKRLVFDKKKNRNKTPVDITLHGGEPTKIGKDKLYSILELITDYLTREDIEFSISMQTNLTLVDEDLATILNKFGVRLGFSFDGIDSNKLRTKNFSDDFFIKKMKMLNKFNVGFRPLIVITKENYKTIFNTLEFLEKEFSIHNIRLNFAEDVTTQKTSESDNFEINGKEFFENVWKKVIDDFITDKTDDLYETNVERIIRKFVFNQLTGEKDREQGNCGVKFCGGGIKVIEVEPDGYVHYCGRYDQSYDIAKVGHVTDKEFLDIQSYRRYIDFLKLKDEVIRNTGCDVCPAKHICDHGCMAFYYSKFGKWGVREDLVCDLYIPMHNYLYENRDKIINKIVKKKRDGNILELNLGKRIRLEE